jgi:sporulation protein YlmC with PRC-barrel domain
MLVPFGTHYDNAGQRIGDVEAMEIDPTSGRITRVIVRRGVIFRTETAIPASVIASVGDRITLSVGADEVRKLARPIVGEPGPAHSR